MNIAIENTTFCGANCVMCVRDKINFELSNMSFELFRKIITEVNRFSIEKYGKGLESIEYGGMGDPLLDSGLEEKLAFIKENYPCVKQCICTTGHVLNEKQDVICKYIDVLKISNYGFSKESYESVHRGNLKYEVIKKNIDELLKIPLGERPRCIISFLVLPINEEEMEDWKEYYEPKCEELYIWKPHNWAGYAESETVHNHKEAKSCGRPGRAFTFRANGDVSVCCWDFNREMSVGNMINETFESIYYGEKLGKVLEMHKKGTFFECKNICSNCDQLYDRQDALIYSSSKEYKVGMETMSKTILQ